MKRFLARAYWYTGHVAMTFAYILILDRVIPHVLATGISESLFVFVLSASFVMCVVVNFYIWVLCDSYLDRGKDSK